jgi:hypothetical protein
MRLSPSFPPSKGPAHHERLACRSASREVVHKCGTHSRAVAKALFYWVSEPCSAAWRATNDDGLAQMRSAATSVILPLLNEHRKPVSGGFTLTRHLARARRVKVNPPYEGVPNALYAISLATGHEGAASAPPEVGFARIRRINPMQSTCGAGSL